VVEEQAMASAPSQAALQAHAEAAAKQYNDAESLAMEEARRLAPHEGNLALLYSLIDHRRRTRQDATALRAAYQAAIARTRVLMDEVPEDDKNHAEYERLKQRLKFPLP
jgi:hypothetical protein